MTPPPSNHPAEWRVLHGAQTSPNRPPPCPACRPAPRVSLGCPHPTCQVPFNDVCLLELRTLHGLYADRVKYLGFSGHHLGIAVDVAAYALGATWNERHFTKDRTWKGTDHAASLEPAGMTKLCRDLKATWKCMTVKETDILPIEAEQRAKLKWGCYNKDKVVK